MKITYDKEADAAYIYLIPENEITHPWVEKTIPLESEEFDGMINLDFDSQGKLGGIEVLDASKKLPESVLNQAQKIGGE